MLDPVGGLTRHAAVVHVQIAPVAALRVGLRAPPAVGAGANRVGGWTQKNVLPLAGFLERQGRLCGLLQRERSPAGCCGGRRHGLACSYIPICPRKRIVPLKLGHVLYCLYSGGIRGSHEAIRHLRNWKHLRKNICGYVPEAGSAGSCSTLDEALSVTVYPRALEAARAHRITHSPRTNPMLPATAQERRFARRRT